MHPISQKTLVAAYNKAHLILERNKNTMFFVPSEDTFFPTGNFKVGPYIGGNASCAKQSFQINQCASCLKLYIKTSTKTF